MERAVWQALAAVAVFMCGTAQPFAALRLPVPAPCCPWPHHSQHTGPAPASTSPPTYLALPFVHSTLRRPQLLPNCSQLPPTAAERWEALQREQRQLLFACAESADAAALHLLDLCALVARGSGSGGGPAAGGAGPQLELDDVVLLVLAAYCLLPDFLPW